MLGLPRPVPIKLSTGTAVLKAGSGGAPPEELLRLQRALTAAQKDLARCRIDLEAANAKLEIFRWAAQEGAADAMSDAPSYRVPMQSRYLQSPPIRWASAESCPLCRALEPSGRSARHSGDLYSNNLPDAEKNEEEVRRWVLQIAPCPPADRLHHWPALVQCVPQVAPAKYAAT